MQVFNAFLDEKNLIKVSEQSGYKKNIYIKNKSLHFLFF